MKKFITIFICVIFCAVFLTACVSSQGKSAYDLYLDMQKAMIDVKSIDMDMSFAMEFTINTEPADYSSGESHTTNNINGNMKQIRKNADDFDMAMDFQTSNSASAGGLNPHAFNWTFKSYYTGGIYYELGIEGESKHGTQHPMTVEDVRRELELDKIVTLDFSETAIKESKITDLDNGGRQVEFTLSGDGMTGYFLEKMRAAYPSPSLENAELIFNDFTCEAVIDKNNMTKSYKMICNVTVTGFSATSFQEEWHYTEEISVTVNSYNNVIIEFPPDLEDYTDINF